MKFEEAYEGWRSGGFTQEEAAMVLGVCDRTFRRYLVRYDEGGLDAVLDKRLTQASHRCAPVDEVMRLTEQYQSRYLGWNAKHFHTWYRKDGGTRGYTWVKSCLQEAGLIKRVKKRGLFSSFYSDRGSHYWHTPEAGGKVDKNNPTQFGQAMKRLGIEMIAAYSPQARGRSERMFRTHQERLPKELALADITDMAAANQYLKEVYLPAFKAEFMQPAVVEGSAFVPWIGGQLEDFLCERHERVVGHDNCVSFNNIKLQIPADQHRCHYVKAKVRLYYAIWMGN